MADEERLRTIERQLAEVDRSTVSLRESIDGIRESIDGIRKPLDVLAEIKQENEQIRQTAAKAEKKATIAATEATQRAKRASQALRLCAFGGLLILVAVTFLTFVSLIGHVDDAIGQVKNLIAEQNQNRYANCVTRNEAVQVQVRQERVLAGADKDPAVQKAHRDFADDLAGKVVDCSKYRVAP